MRETMPTTSTAEAMQVAIDRLVAAALAEDLGEAGDVTSAATIPADQTITGRITAKAPGVIAGLRLVEAVYAAIDPAVHVINRVADGTAVEPGTVVAEVSGRGRAVLTGERTALNFLGRLSGVASLTAQFVAAAAGTDATILDTRKTTPGFRLLEKYAVRMGGGQNHRVGLYDMVLIKDNHIDAAGGITAAVAAVRCHAPSAGLPVVLEVKTLTEVDEALPLNVDRLLLDNMSLGDMRAAVERTAGRVALEASGNMTLDRVAEVAATGVDFISVGALTHSAPVLDLSMRLETGV